MHNGVNDYEEGEEMEVSDQGRVYDLIIASFFLIISCIVGMLYTGGFFEGVSFITAFTNCDASRGLVLGFIFYTSIYLYFVSS